LDWAKRSLLREVAVAGAVGALAAIARELYIKSGAITPSASVAWRAAVYAFTVLVQSGALLGGLIGFILRTSCA
jgi:hypothetical protein